MTSSFVHAVRYLMGSLAALALTAPSARAAEDPHAHHHHQQADASPGYKRQLANYRIPELGMTRADGSSARIDRALDDGRPVVLNFIFTTCTAVCPLLSQTTAEMRRKLGPDAANVHFVSISIDPEQDTPQQLTTYAAQFGADKNWSYFTGSVAHSVKLQKAFQVYFGDKMHHRPVTLMRSSPGAPWVRLEGFATPDDLLTEFRRTPGAP